MTTTFNASGTLAVAVQVTLSESAARALYTLAMFDEGVFADAAKKAIGSAVTPDVEAGLKELFAAAYEGIRPIVTRADKARRVFEGRDA